MAGIARARNSAGDAVLRISAGQAGDQLVNVMLVIVIAAAIGLIGTDVTEEINQSATDGSFDPTNNTFDQASDNITGGFADSMGLVDIVFIVLMFGVILSVLLAFRMRT